jgi:hypothetical protein
MVTDSLLHRLYKDGVDALRAVLPSTSISLYHTHLRMAGLVKTVGLVYFFCLAHPQHGIAWNPPTSLPPSRCGKYVYILSLKKICIYTIYASCVEI